MRVTSSLHQSLVIDDAIHAYVEWREECAQVWKAYGWWTNAPRADVGRAHAAYRAALDREEAAATAYAGLIKRVGHLMETGPDLAENECVDWTPAMRFIHSNNPDQEE